MHCCVNVRSLSSVSELTSSAPFTTAQFKVHVRGPGIVSFESTIFKDKWLAINHDQLLVVNTPHAVVT